MAKKLENAMIVSEDALDAADHLGWWTMFTLPDEERSGAKLVRAWAKHGLDIDDLPEARQPVHVFQSACASVKQRRQANKQGERTEITADEVHNNGRGCIYQVTVRTWDQVNDVIEHEKALRVRFDKAKSAIEFDHLGSTDKRLGAIEKAITKHFEANAKTVPGQKVRNAVRATLLKLGAQNLRRKAGGVYFVPAEWKNGKVKPTKPTLDGLAGVLEDLYGDRADFYALPLANADTEKAMVAKHFVLNVNERSQDLMAKAVARVRQGKGERGVRKDMLENMYTERRRLAGAIDQFKSLVDLEQSDIEANLRDLDQALMQLQDLADADK